MQELQGPLIVARAIMRLIPALLSMFSFLGCQRNRDVPVPDTHWDLFERPDARPLSMEKIRALEGVYQIDSGREKFGDTAVAKLSYTRQGNDTSVYLSLFFEKEIAYYICQAKQIGDTILLNGYWRMMENSETGKVHLSILPENGARRIVQGSQNKIEKGLLISGNWGEDQLLPDQSIELNYTRPLYNGSPFEIVAHRGGGRITDFLPASENSIELIRMASRFGATGVEIDVQFTKDKIPILYHDKRINDRLTQRSGIRGLVSKYTFAELEQDVRLKKGEKIPTLQQALKTIIQQTPLRLVWIDAKDSRQLEQLRVIQSQFMSEAAAAGRELQILIGIHDDEVYNHFKLLPGFKSIPSLCELDPEKAHTIGARIWAPMWTEGLQKEEVAGMHARGRKAFVWTLDGPDEIKEFMNEGGYDGIVSNFPSLVAYYYYSRK